MILQRLVSVYLSPGYSTFMNYEKLRMTVASQKYYLGKVRTTIMPQNTN